MENIAYKVEIALYKYLIEIVYYLVDNKYEVGLLFTIQILFDEHGPPHHTTPHPSLIHTTLTIGEIGEICEKKSIK